MFANQPRCQCGRLFLSFILTGALPKSVQNTRPKNRISASAEHPLNAAFAFSLETFLRSHVNVTAYCCGGSTLLMCILTRCTAWKHWYETNHEKWNFKNSHKIKAMVVAVPISVVGFLCRVQPFFYTWECWWSLTRWGCRWCKCQRCCGQEFLFFRNGGLQLIRLSQI